MEKEVRDAWASFQEAARKAEEANLEVSLPPRFDGALTLCAVGPVEKKEPAPPADPPPKAKKPLFGGENSDKGS